MDTQTDLDQAIEKAVARAVEPLKAKLNTLETEINRMKASHGTEIQSLKVSHETEIQSLKEIHAKTIQGWARFVESCDYNINEMRRRLGPLLEQQNMRSCRMSFYLQGRV